MKEVIELVRSTKEIIFDKVNVNTQSEKGIADYVTLADLKVQNYIEKELSVLFPDDQFMGEESKSNDLDFSKPTWILDPIDGTTNLMHDYQQSAVSLALWQNNQIEFGVVYNPFTEELFYASLGKGAFLNEQPIHVTKYSEMKDSLISVGLSPYAKQDSVNDFKVYQKIFLDCQDLRRSGSAALDIAYVACGRTESFFEKTLKPWDFAAGSIILKEAGGTITDFYNEPVNSTKSSSILASNGALHSKMLDYLKDIRL